MSKLKIAIQKSGRLNKDSLSLLKDCGIKISTSENKLKISSSNFPIEILFLRNADIPQYIESGIADVGIIGENTLIEKAKETKTLLKLGFSKCRVSLAVLKNKEATSLQYFEGKKIATSYPNTLRQFLTKNQITANIHTISGSVEIAPNIGLADGICDIVSTGNTLYNNGLKEIQVLLESEAVLATNANLSIQSQNILDQLIFRMRSVLRAKSTKYILLNTPNKNIEEISKILPVLKSPTVLPLVKPGWSSLHSVIREDEFWNVLDQLKNAGAEDILIIPVDKMIA